MERCGVAVAGLGQWGEKKEADPVRSASRLRIKNEFREKVYSSSIIGSPIFLWR